MNVKAWVLIALCGLAGASMAANLTATVKQVIDGDSLRLEPDAKGQELEVRLEGIDAPEGCQPGGEQARQALSDFVSGKSLSLKVQGKDSYGRTLATVSVDGLNINERMVAEGHAWSLRYKWDKGPYVEKERTAKALRRGLHATAGAVMPKDFRRSHGPCGGAPPAAAPAAAPAKPVARTDPVVALPPVQTASIYRCDGRTHCSQMRSCDEATFFLQNCPGVKMDGNQDGVPCEKQWCRR